MAWTRCPSPPFPPLLTPSQGPFLGPSKPWRDSSSWAFWGKKWSSGSCFSSLGFHKVSMAGHFSCPSGARWEVISLGKMLLCLTRKDGWSCGGIMGLGQAYPHMWGGGGGQCPRCCTGSLSPQPRQDRTPSCLLPPYLTTVGAEWWGESSQIMTGIFAPTSWGYSSVTTVNNFLLG